MSRSVSRSIFTLPVFREKSSFTLSLILIHARTKPRETKERKQVGCVQCLHPCQLFSLRLISSWMTCSNWPSYLSRSCWFNSRSQKPISTSWSIRELSLGVGTSLSTGVQVFSGGVQSLFGGVHSVSLGCQSDLGGVYCKALSHKM